jgi:endonuclease YncB( thermonuclease family)
MIDKLSVTMAFLVVFASGAWAQQIPSPYPEYHGTVERVIDGDTMVVRLDLWPGLEAVYSVRARGIDAPELRGAKCPQEKLWAEDAKARAERLYGPGTTVRIENVEMDSFGRAVADIRRWRSDRWMYFSEEMTERDMAQPWQDGWPDIDWCKASAAPWSGQGGSVEAPMSKLAMAPRLH